MRGDPPVWFRALVAADRIALSLGGLVRNLVDVTLCAFTPAEAREARTRWAYDRQHAAYAPGSPLHQAGLFSWERALLGAPPFPSSGRLLLGGAGGGRELVALQALGYRVLALEPSSLAEACRDLAGEGQVVQASYEELIAAVERGGGALYRALEGEPFAGVMLGWGSLSHVTTPAMHARLLAALRQLAPSAPVIASFHVLPDRPARIARVRAPIGRLYEHLGADPVPEGLRFGRETGFLYCFSPRELHALAAAAGYAVNRFETEEYPHALLVPSG